MTKTKKNTPPAEKKRGPNAGSFSAERPSPAAFEPGISGNPGGAPRHFRALARALRISGQGRASDAECDLLGLPRGSSKIQIAAERILWTMRKGSTSEQLAASDLFARLTGEFAPTRLSLGLDPDMEESDQSGLGPRLIVRFTESTHSRLAREAREREAGALIDAQPARDLDPDAEAARAEQNHTVIADSPVEAEPEVLPPSQPPAAEKLNVFAALAPPKTQPRQRSNAEIRQRIFEKLRH